MNNNIFFLGKKESIFYDLIDIIDDNYSGERSTIWINLEYNR